MVIGPNSLRKNPAFPMLAVLTAFLLVSGQVFNCCRLNETLSENLGLAMKRLGRWVNSSAKPAESKMVRSHPGCHGHSATEVALAPDLPLTDSPIQWRSAEVCLSELDSAPKALQPASIPDAGSFFPTSPVPATVPPLKLSQFEHPRPQNKSSPPIYLLTLRILV